MRRITFVLAFVLWLSAALPAQPPRILAIGDIHGSLTGVTGILRAAGLIDGSSRWTGGTAVLMQTGDYMDRGEDVRAVMELLIALETQARESGGRVLALLGNHEVMNLLGETRDANPPIFATFADAQSEARRQDGWTAYATLAAARQAQGEPLSDVYKQSREHWMDAHPPGYIEYRAAMGPGGKYGRWLRAKPMVATYGGTIFMHAGINPARAPDRVDDLNDKLRDEVRRMDRFVQRLVERKLALPDFTLQEVVQVAAAESRSPDPAMQADAQAILKLDTWLSLDPEQALWYRGLASLADDPSGGPFAALLTRYRQRRFVTGHTPTPDRAINVRFGGRALLIDTGMNTQYYRGRGSALEMIGDQLTAIYEDGTTRLQ